MGELGLDYETLIACLLHDTIEDTAITQQSIEQIFGANVAMLVEGVSKLDKLNFHDRQEAEAENFCKMVMAMVRDVRVILIKLADRLHNMRTLGSLRVEKRRRIARETLEIYSPLAHRLGIHQLKIELEELGFEAYFPTRYRVLKNVVRAARGNRKEVIQRTLAEISWRLEGAAITAKVSGREKHLYSIYQKMCQKEQRFHSIMDIYAFRIIVEDVDTCYRALGQMHNLYKPRPGRFKDYIAIPRNNGYQSLHTSMIGPHGIPVEVQIRTEEMGQIAEMGVAAHWAYKQGSRFGSVAQFCAQTWMQSLVELKQSSISSVEFIESVKSDLISDQIYIFTPNGRIVELPINATPVDFAYAVHTDIGNACIGARVDRHAYPLSQPLLNGQTVEIIIASGAQPSAAWLNFLVTSKARTKVRQTLKNLKREDSIKLGHRLLTHALGCRLDMIPAPQLQQLIETMKFGTMDNLLAEIGCGNLMSAVVARRLSTTDQLAMAPSDGQRSFPIVGSEGLLVTLAKCCRPIYGDPIIAHISPGKGLVVHHDCCHNVRSSHKESDKFMAVQWDPDSSQSFITELKVEIVNYQRALSHLITTINGAKSAIHSLITEDHDSRMHVVYLQLKVHDRVHLAFIMRKIKKMPNTIKVSRHRS